MQSIQCEKETSSSIDAENNDAGNQDFVFPRHRIYKLGVLFFLHMYHRLPWCNHRCYPLVFQHIYFLKITILNWNIHCFYGHLQ